MFALEYYVQTWTPTQPTRVCTGNVIRVLPCKALVATPLYRNFKHYSRAIEKEGLLIQLESIYDIRCA